MRFHMGHFWTTFYNDFLGRFDGPLHFRLFMQPLMAILLAVRDGRQDARTGRGAYLWSLLADPTQRAYLLHHGWQQISRVFLLAVTLDVVYQLLEWERLRPLQALLTAAVLAMIPYLVLRGPINRLARRMQARSGSVRR